MLARNCRRARTAALLLSLTIAAFVTSPASAEDDAEFDPVPNVVLGDEYTEYQKLKPGKTPKQETPFWRKALLYLPNRFLDLIEIVKADVGVGPSFGAVVRLTKYGQVGARSVAPFSARAGLRGRKFPLFLEHSSEFGIGPLFVESHDRSVGSGEVGAGVDLVVAGAYLGVDFVALTDFFLGIFGADVSDDDLK